MTIRRLFLLWIAACCVATMPVSADADEASTAPPMSEDDMKKACNAWYKRVLKRNAQAIRALKKVKNDTSATKAVETIEKIFADEEGNLIDPCPDWDMMNELYPPLKDKKLRKAALSNGKQLNRIQNLLDEGKISASAAGPVFDTAMKYLMVEEP